VCVNDALCTGKCSVDADCGDGVCVNGKFCCAVCPPTTTTSTLVGTCGAECSSGCGSCLEGGICVVAGGAACNHLGSTEDVCIPAHYGCDFATCASDADCGAGKVCVLGDRTYCCTICQ
jgi:hypothetical protein